MKMPLQQTLCHKMELPPGEEDEPKLILMAQYITTLTQGISSRHLCHQGRTVFSSPFYMTGGSVVPGIIFKDGEFRDARQPLRVLGVSELVRHFRLPVVTRWQFFWHSVGECLSEWTLPFRKGKKRRWNPLLG
jgi:hypothetical protein